MSSDFDVIVVGAGPAGVSTALSCYNEGLDVLLIDKKPKEDIGNKVCGEAISKKTVTFVSKKLNINLPQNEEINSSIKELVLRTANTSNHIVLPAIGYMVDRHKYGQRLLQEILDRKITLLENTKVMEPIIIDDKISGVKTKNKQNKIKEYKAKIVVDCSGILAVIRTNLPQDFEPMLNTKLEKADYASCYREIIKLEKDHDLSNKIVLQYEEDIPDPGYIWFFADGKKKLNCGTGFIKTGENQKKSVKKVYFQAMEKYYPNGTYKTLDGRGGNVPIRPPLWNAVGAGLIVAGDAAFHADPLTAEGHGPALLAGLFAGEIASEAIKAGQYLTENLWRYNKLIMEHFGASHARYRILTIALEKIGSKNLEFLLKRKVIKQEDLTTEGIMKKRSIFGYLKRAINCFPKYGLLLLMKKAIDTSKAVAQLCENFPTKLEDFAKWKEEIKKLYVNL